MKFDHEAFGRARPVMETATGRPGRDAAAGRAGLAAEAARLAQIRARATPPEACGPEIPVAPARGAAVAFEPMAMAPKGAEGWEAQPAGWRGRWAVRGADVFDLMLADAARRKQPAPLSPGQVAMGRLYRDLVERHAASGLRCASLEAGRSGGGDGTGFLDAVLETRARIERLHRRIGPGAALSVRRVRPSARGGPGARLISDRALVDAVCIGNQTLSAVLRAHGWGKRADRVEALRIALVAALDRMQGYPEKGA